MQLHQCSSTLSIRYTLSYSRYSLLPLFIVITDPHAAGKILRTHTISPEILETAAASSSQDVDLSIRAAAGVFVAVTWRLAALREPSPQTRTALTHSGRPPISWDSSLTGMEKENVTSFGNML